MDESDADRHDAIQAALLLGALWAPKDAAARVTAWLDAHGLARNEAELDQDADQTWLARDQYWFLAMIEGTTDG